MLPVELAVIDLPEFGVPTVEPTISAANYANRIDQARQRAATAGLDALVIYGDKEHFANLTYLTGYDPRFEEALLIIVPGRDATLVVGLEGWGYSELSTAPIQRILYRSFSLMGMPREGFGFSRSPVVRFGPPKFEQVHIKLASGLTRQVIRMQYIL